MAAIRAAVLLIAALGVLMAACVRWAASASPHHKPEGFHGGGGGGGGGGRGGGGAQAYANTDDDDDDDDDDEDYTLTAKPVGVLRQRQR